jgi:hypothetical protein
MMNMAMHPAQNAAQGSILGGLGAMGADYSSQNASRRIEQWFDHQRQTTVQIINADNGFVVIVKPDYGHAGRMLVASTIEEVRDLITSELVAKKMEK